MDDADRAEEAIEAAMDDAIGEARRHLDTGPAYTGCCHYCGDITGGGRRFCDAECRDDYEAERHLQHIKGKT